MADSQDVLVEVEDLQVYFYLHEGVVRAVDGVSFSIHQGQTLGVIGESGSGKSVSAQSMMGIVPSPPAKRVGGKILMHLSENGKGYRVVNLTDLPEKLSGKVPPMVACCADAPIDRNSKIMSMLIVIVLFMVVLAEG